MMILRVKICCIGSLEEARLAGDMVHLLLDWWVKCLPDRVLLKIH
jgi:hypothetical protein